MDIMRLDIQATPARLDMQGQNVQLGEAMPPASADFEVEKGSVSVHVQRPQLSIDATVAQSEEGHATTAQLTSEFAQEGTQAAQEAAQQYNDMGRLYRTMTRNKNAISQHALEVAVPAMPTYSLRFVPSEPPHMSFSDNEFSYEITPDKMQTQWTVHQNADISVDRPAELSIWVAQEPELHFSAQA